MADDIQITRGSEATPTPAQELIAAARPEAILDAVNDEGVAIKITARKPGILAQKNLMRAVSAEDGVKPGYTLTLAPLLWVAAIDGVPVPLPTTEAEIDALFLRLGEGGYNAIQVYRESLGKKAAEADKALLKG